MGVVPREERTELINREQEILASFSRGMSYAVIAEKGCQAIYDIRGKLGVGTKQEIVV